MAKLSLLPNETQKDVPTQLQQIFMALNDTQNWAGKILTQRLIDYTDAAASTAFTATSYQPMTGYTFQITNSNPLCIISFNLYLTGNGSVGIFVNDALVREMPFDHGTNKINMFLSDEEQLTVGTNSISIKMKVLAGTVTKNQGLNIVQITSFNS